MKLSVKQQPGRILATAVVTCGLNDGKKGCQEVLRYDAWAYNPTTGLHRSDVSEYARTMGWVCSDAGLWYCPGHGAEARGKVDTDATAEEIQVLLLLIGIEVDPAVIATWSLKDRRLATNYAIRVHLRASDNPVRVPKKPTILDGCKEITSHDL